VSPVPETDLLERAQRTFARRQRSVRRRGRMPWVTGGLAVVVLAAVVWIVYFSSWLAVSAVEVRGLDTVSRATVLRAAAVPAGVPLARLDTGAVADRVRGIAAVADASVSRSWPDRVVVTVTERVAVVVVTGGGGYELVDATGVAFRTVQARPDGLPVAHVTGPRRDVTVRSVVTVSAALPADLRSRVRSIEASSPDSITLELDDDVKVVWGSAEQSPRKAEVLAALMHRQAKVYDVSAPELPVTQGETR
jgi:cell division protein FtsQ